MRVLIGSPGCEFPPGVLLSDLAVACEKKMSDDPTLQALVQKTGKSQLVFIVNGVVVKASKLHRRRLREGDDVRIQHPFFGG